MKGQQPSSEIYSYDSVGVRVFQDQGQGHQWPTFERCCSRYFRTYAPPGTKNRDSESAEERLMSYAQ
jgi:hypothetical protein